MERFDLREEYKDDWLQQIAAGKTDVTPTYQHDDYWDFLTAHAPIYDSEGRYSGFVGVDFDLQYYLAQEARFHTIAIGGQVGALIVALVIGLLVTLYDSAIRRRIQELYDWFTGGWPARALLTRRAATHAIYPLLRRHAASIASLLVDIDNLKKVNDVRGHVAGDAVITCTAEVIRESIREGDECARVGGDEFLIFAPDCDNDGAEEIARHVFLPECPSTGCRWPA